MKGIRVGPSADTADGTVGRGHQSHPSGYRGSTHRPCVVGIAGRENGQRNNQTAAAAYDRRVIGERKAGTCKKVIIGEKTRRPSPGCCSAAAYRSCTLPVNGCILLILQNVIDSDETLTACYNITSSQIGIFEPVVSRRPLMKNKGILLLSFSCMLFWTCSNSHEISEKDYEILAGTWMNKEYESIRGNVKYEVNSDGTFISFAKMYHIEKNVYREGVYEIVEKWRDEAGNIFLKTMTWYGEKVEGEPWSYELDKISEDGSVWEWVFSRAGFPEAVDKNNYNYGIYYRQ